jgi:hypothetical protein
MRFPDFIISAPDEPRYRADQIAKTYIDLNIDSILKESIRKNGLFLQEIRFDVNNVILDNFLIVEDECLNETHYSHSPWRANGAKRNFFLRNENSDSYLKARVSRAIFCLGHTKSYSQEEAFHFERSKEERRESIKLKDEVCMIDDGVEFFSVGHVRSYIMHLLGSIQVEFKEGLPVKSAKIEVVLNDLSNEVPETVGRFIYVYHRFRPSYVVWLSEATGSPIKLSNDIFQI